MKYSRQIKTISAKDVPGSLNTLLNQINLVQDETERALKDTQASTSESVSAVLAALNDIKGRVAALEKAVAALGS